MATDKVVIRVVTREGDSQEDPQGIENVVSRIGIEPKKNVSQMAHTLSTICANAGWQATRVPRPRGTSFLLMAGCQKRF
jgi:hypothetical protein